MALRAVAPATGRLNARGAPAGGVTDRRAWTLLVGGAGAYGALLFAWFSLAAYLPTVTADLGLSGTGAGLLAGAVPLTYVPVSLVSGPLVDRFGPYRSIGAGVLVVGVAHVGRSAATAFPAMLAATVLLGVGGTAITFGLPKLVSEQFPAGEAGPPSTVYLLGSVSGTAASFTLGRGVLGPAAGGWRPLFAATGVACVVYGGLWAGLVVALGPERPADGGDADVASVRRVLRAVLSNPGMRLLLVVGVVYLGVVHGVQNWLATVLEARGVAATTAAASTGVFVAAQAGGTLVLPALSDCLGRRGGVVAGCGLACALGVGALAVPSAPLALALGGAVAAGVGAGGLSPLVRMVPAELDGVGAERTGAAVGVVFAAGELGGFGAPVLVGALHDATGSYAAGFGLLAAGALWAVVAGRRLPV